MRTISLPLNTVAFSTPVAVVTGRHFNRLSLEERAAVLAHEEGHRVNCHTAKRLLWLFQGRWLHPVQWMEDAREHEFEADAYAVHHGHAVGMLAFLDRFPANSHPDPLHPTPAERIDRICHLLAEGAVHG